MKSLRHASPPAALLPPVTLLPPAVLLPLAALFLTAPLPAATLAVPAQHATIQAAIDAARPGDTVLVDPGTYHERLKLAAGVQVRSQGDDRQGKLGLARAESTRIDGTGLDADAPGVLMAAGATLDGFTVTGFGRYDEQLWNQHHATRGDEQSHEHIGHFGAPGIGIVGVDCTVRNNLVHHNGDTGIGIRGSDAAAGSCSPLVVANVCYRNMGGGIGSMQGSTAIIKRNVCFQNFYAGIGHDGASPLVLDNTCYENIRAGIGVSEGACPVVRGNRCYRNRRAGIGVRTGSETAPVIENNECYENGMAGIGCEEEAAPIIRNNRCYRNAMAGIGAQHAARPLIVGNQCYENQMAGIGTRDGSRPVIVDNVCRENQQAGIGVRTESRAVICYNRCQENKLVAIGLPDGGQALIHGNQLVRTGGMPPLVAIKGGSQAVLTENQLQGGGVAGILVEGQAHILDNQFQGQGPGQGSAIWVWAKSQATVSGNLFRDYRHAVNASQATVTASGNEIHGTTGAAIRVKQPLQPAHVHGNRIVADQPLETLVDVDQPRGIVAGNEATPQPQPQPQP